MFYIGSLGKNKTVSIISRLPEKDINSYLEYIRHVNRFKNIVEFIKVVLDSYNKLSEWISKFVNNEIEYYTFQNELDLYIMSYLTSIKAFLDNWETYLKKKYGKQSKEVELFLTLTHLEYDGYFAYRFIDQYRNYVQHCGKPVSSIDCSLNQKNTNEIKAFIDKDTFINGFNMKATFKNELQVYPGKINILDFIEQEKDCLYRIQEKMVNGLVDFNLIKSCTELLGLKVNYGKNLNNICLINFDREMIPQNINIDDIINLDIYFIPLELITKVLLALKKSNEKINEKY